MLKLFGGATTKSDLPVVDQIVTFFGVGSTSVTLTSDQVGIMAAGSFLEDNNPITYTDSVDWTTNFVPTSTATVGATTGRRLVSKSDGPASSNPRWTGGRPAGRAVKFSNSTGAVNVTSDFLSGVFAFSYSRTKSNSVYVVYAVWCQDSNPVSGTPSTSVNGIMNTAGWTTLAEASRVAFDPEGTPQLISYRDGLWMSSRNAENIFSSISGLAGMVAVWEIQNVV